MCSSPKYGSLHIDYKLIDEVTIKRYSDKLEYSISDPVQIKELFTKYLYSTKKNPFKFRPSYGISFIYKKEVYSLLVNNKYLNNRGTTYSLRFNLEDYLQKIFTEKYLEQ